MHIKSYKIRIPPIEKTKTNNAKPFVISKIINMTESNQNLTEEQKRIQRLRAKTAARENQVCNRVGDKVTDPVILAELEKKSTLGAFAKLN